LQEKLNSLAEAIEGRLSKFIHLKQFHFRYTKEMIFDIVNNCSSWNPDRTKNDLQNLRVCFENIDGWGVPVVLDAPDVKSMGSVNEKGFLLFFALFIPSLEGTAGPKKQAKQKQEEKKVEPVVVVEDSGEIVRLQKRIVELEAEKVEVKEVAVEANQQVENLSMESETLSSTIQDLENKIVVLTDELKRKPKEVVKDNSAEMRNLRNELDSTYERFEQTKNDCQEHMKELRAAAAKNAELENRLRELENKNRQAEEEAREWEKKLAGSQKRADALADRLRAQDFDGLEAKYLALIQELSLTSASLKEARLESELALRKLHALELKMPLYLRQGKNTVPPPVGNVTLCFTDVEGSTVQWEWDADSMAVAIRVHNDLMRTKLHEWGGYEVKTEGDAFMVAFEDPMTAVNWCLDLQESLLTAQWPEPMYQHEKSKIVESKRTGKLLYQGLRVRMGIHNGNPSAEEDPVVKFSFFSSFSSSFSSCSKPTPVFIDGAYGLFRPYGEPVGSSGVGGQRRTDCHVE
jgi:class 3 adenylate cyclase